MKFRKKPVVIEATQWFKLGDHPKVTLHPTMDPDIQQPGIWTLEGLMYVTPGDWIITGVQGEHYPCKPDIFEQTYEAAPLRPCARSATMAEPETQEHLTTQPRKT